MEKDEDIVMKISKNILTSALAVVTSLSIITGTLLYAYEYTSNHAEKSSSFQKGNGRMNQGEFQKKDGDKVQSGYPNVGVNKPVD